MERGEIEERVVRSVEQLLRQDRYLLERDVNERSITHRLAVHLSQAFAGWDVDCEYNRDGSDPKRLDLPRKTDIASDDEYATTVFPDVIVHHRGTDENLVVVEAKKTTNPDDGEWDRRKLQAFRSSEQLAYRATVFLLLKTRKGHELGAEIHFADGRMTQLLAAATPSQSTQ